MIKKLLNKFKKTLVPTKKIQRPTFPYAVKKDTLASQKFLTYGVFSKEYVVHNKYAYPKVYLGDDSIQILFNHTNTHIIDLSSEDIPIFGWNRLVQLERLPFPWRREI